MKVKCESDHFFAVRWQGRLSDAVLIAMQLLIQYLSKEIQALKK